MRGWDSIRETLDAAWRVGRLSVLTVGQHWGVAALSLLIAFAIWFIVTDVENPRTTAVFPAETEPGIPVEFVNVPEGFIVPDRPQVHLTVEARQEELEDLSPDDFTVRVDMLNAIEGSADRLVRVTPDSESIRVIGVDPPTVTARLEESFSKQVDVSVRPTGNLPEGFIIAEPATIQPARVTVAGQRELVDRVARVELPVDLTGKRVDFDFSGELVAVDEGGDVLTPMLSETRGTASYVIEQESAEHPLAVVTRVNGAPAKGFLVTNIRVEPSFINVTGPQSVIEGLDGSLTVSPVDVSGASTPQTLTRPVTLPPNVSSATTNVTVVVTIEPIACGPDSGEDFICDEFTIFAAPRITNIPPGLLVAEPSLQVQVRVSGPIDQISGLAPDDLVATVSLAGAVPGSQLYDVDVTFNQGFDDLEVRETPRIRITLNPIPITQSSGP